MTNKTKILLFIFIGLGILGIVAYGYFSTKQLDEHKATAVDSNIKDFVYDEAKDTLDFDEEEEDLDGEEAEVEDDDFEVYEEDGLWDEDDETAAKTNPENDKAQADDKLEELYDNKPKPVKTKPITKPGPKPSPTVKPNTLPTDSGNFLVVVGSFKSKRNAGKKKEVLEKLGIKGEIIQLKGSALHLVIAARFSTEAEAEVFKEELTAEHGLKAFVKEVS